MSTVATEKRLGSQNLHEDEEDQMLVSPASSARSLRPRKLNNTAEQPDLLMEDDNDSNAHKRRRARNRSKKGETPAKKKVKEVEIPVEEVDMTVEEVDMTVEEVETPVDEAEIPKKRQAFAVKRQKGSRERDDDDQECYFVGDQIPDPEARDRWPKRYEKKKVGLKSTGNMKGGDDEEQLIGRCHYYKAKIDTTIYSLNDYAYVKAAEGEPNFICQIIELFESVDGQKYFTARWFYRAEDTIITKQHSSGHDKRRVFLSEDMNDNPLNCIVSKLKIVKVSPNINIEAKEEAIPPCDYYYDMTYAVEYTTFACVPDENEGDSSEASSVTSSEDIRKCDVSENVTDCTTKSKEEYSLLDLFSGCGAMSTGLCYGAQLSGLNLETQWAVDLNQYACDSLKLNHPKTQVRNEKAEDFLALIREWEKMCHKYAVIGSQRVPRGDEGSSDDEDDVKDVTDVAPGEFEVEKLVGICYGDPNNVKQSGLYFKVRWKGYGPSDDTWEPIEGLSNCHESIENFVKTGYRRNLLPLPGSVDVICGGPPCQGVSGFNRFRNQENPLEDPKNHQLVVYMDIVEHLKPKFVLMENVVDILKFAKGFLGRYALSRLVSMNYQARLGMMVAGCYGLAQFRMRAFLWGALPTEQLPQFPLPTHNVIVRGGFPNEFAHSIVAFEEGQHVQLSKALQLGDCISDLPSVQNDETSDEMHYGRLPTTEFQRFIRLSKEELLDCCTKKKKACFNKILYDHRPLQLNNDDYLRVCRIPKRKGANFRDLPGVTVGGDNVVQLDPNVERVYLPSKKPLVPDYAISFVKGKSSKPFGRLWWDETVPTVVTRAEPHNQIILHPEQDRVLTIRENARLQGFPDFYKLKGPVKERYIQVGNAVAIPVARALGYALGLAYQQEKSSNGPLFTLPPKFPCLGDYLEQDIDVNESVEVTIPDAEV